MEPVMGDRTLRNPHCRKHEATPTPHMAFKRTPKQLHLPYCTRNFPPLSETGRSLLGWKPLFSLGVSWHSMSVSGSNINDTSLICRTGRTGRFTRRFHLPSWSTRSSSVPQLSTTTPRMSHARCSIASEALLAPCRQGFHFTCVCFPNFQHPVLLFNMCLSKLTPHIQWSGLYPHHPQSWNPKKTRFPGSSQHRSVPNKVHKLICMI